MLDVISFLFHASTTAYHAVVNTKEQSKQRREEASAFLSDIASTLVSIIKQLESGEAPHGQCAKIRGFADAAPSVLHGIASEDMINSFVSDLREVQDIERFLLFMSDTSKLYMLKVAAWNFSDAALHIKNNHSK